MIDPSKFYELLVKRDLNFFVGVPDSLLKSFCAYIDEHSPQGKHIIAANEGNAIGIASGYHLSTKKIPVVYMQNSGLGNCINPLTSLTDKEVYSIPMILLIGWRGEPGFNDEPQHLKQGITTKKQLKAIGLDFFIIDEKSDLKTDLNNAIDLSLKISAPVALLIRKRTFKKFEKKNKTAYKESFSREDAIKNIISLIGKNDLIVSTTGKTSRELYEIRKENEEVRDFMTVGSMGHTSSIALGVALGAKDKRVICLDGDGSLLMHLGSVPIIGSLSPNNFIHVLLNNSAHESVGGQPTVAKNINFKKLSNSCGYENYFLANNTKTLKSIWKKIERSTGPTFLELQISISTRDDLGRPESSPLENKKTFMEYIDQK